MNSLVEDGIDSFVGSVLCEYPFPNVALLTQSVADVLGVANSLGLRLGWSIVLAIVIIGCKTYPYRVAVSANEPLVFPLKDYQADDGVGIAFHCDVWKLYEDERVDWATPIVAVVHAYAAKSVLVNSRLVLVRDGQGRAQRTLAFLTVVLGLVLSVKPHNQYLVLRKTYFSGSRCGHTIWTSRAWEVAASSPESSSKLDDHDCSILDGLASLM